MSPMRISSSRSSLPTRLMRDAVRPSVCPKPSALDDAASSSCAVAISRTKASMTAGAFSPACLAIPARPRWKSSLQSRKMKNASSRGGAGGVAAPVESGMVAVRALLSVAVAARDPSAFFLIHDASMFLAGGYRTVWLFFRWGDDQCCAVVALVSGVVLLSFAATSSFVVVAFFFAVVGGATGGSCGSTVSSLLSRMYASMSRQPS